MPPIPAPRDPIRHCPWSALVETVNVDSRSTIMNKYDVAAIRKDLDDCVRNTAWRRFRNRLNSMLPSDHIPNCDNSSSDKDKDNDDGTDDTHTHSRTTPSTQHDLFRAVVEARTRVSSNTARYSHGRHESLLHALCRKTNCHPPVPIDIIERIASVCPHLLLPTSHCSTPLSIAIDKEASVVLIECLIVQDMTRRSLHAPNAHGDAPVLQAIRQDSSFRDDIVQLLVDHDVSRQSLLLTSRKRAITPLVYVANDELRRLDMRNELVSMSAGIDENDEPLSELLQYLLVETHRAICFARDPQSIPKERAAAPSVDHDCMQDDDSSDGDCDNVWPSMDANGNYSHEHVDQDLIQRQLALLRASIACSHLLLKVSSRLMQHVLLRIQPSHMRHRDINGDSMLHHACRAQDAQRFWESTLMLHGSDSVGRCREATNLMKYLTQIDPESLHHCNGTDGSTPLHLALRCRHPPAFWLPLVKACPRSIQQARRSDGRLPLYIAIDSYRRLEEHVTIDSICGGGDGKTNGNGNTTGKEAESDDVPQLIANQEGIHSAILETWKLFPEAATIADPTTGLVAFQFAALAPQHAQNEPSNKRKEIKQPKATAEPQPRAEKQRRRKHKASDTSRGGPGEEISGGSATWLNLIYFFLRSSPEVLGHDDNT